MPFPLSLRRSLERATALRGVAFVGALAAGAAVTALLLGLLRTGERSPAVLPAAPAEASEAVAHALAGPREPSGRVAPPSSTSPRVPSA